MNRPPSGPTCLGFSLLFVWISPLILVTAMALIVPACSVQDGSSHVSTDRDRPRADTPAGFTDSLRFARVLEGPPVTDAASTGGVSWADVDGDGDPDLFAANGYDVSAAEPVPQKNRLYRNDGGGRFTPVETGVLAEDDGFSSGSTWGDMDNDGDLDGFIPNQRGQDNFLYRNDGGGVFARVSGTPPAADGGHSYAAAWVDVDNDGFLDLYVANGGLSHSGPDFLYRNGGGTFTRITEGEIATLDIPSGGGVWGDCDDDGDADLFVPNRVGNNALFRNDGGWHFTRVTEGPLVTDGRPAMAAAWGDMDGDGDLDLYVGNTYGMANSLYRNDGDMRFTPVTSGPAVLDGGHTYAVNWADADSDGDLDLLAVNWGAAAVLYSNDGGGRFARAPAGDLGQTIGYGSSAAWADADGDGDLDLLVGSWPNAPGPEERNHYYRNESPPRNWLKIRLLGTDANRSAVGARIRLRARIAGKPVIQTREVTAHTGWRSQNSLVQHFGLGDADEAEEIEVRWPSGRVERLNHVAANQLIAITESKGLTRRNKS